MASVSLFVILGAGGVLAQTAPATPPATGGTALDEITVTATRNEERAVDTMASVSVTSRREIQNQQPGRIGTIISQMPGVTTQENPNDPATAINIRGLQDFGRVAVTVDGARQNFQRSGHNANGAFFLDPAFIRTIDVTRGPVANIYGSGAIGGVASFETVDPKDVLRPGEKFATELGFTSVLGRQTGAYGHGIGAIRPYDWLSGLVGFSFRQTGAYRDGGSNKILDSGQELRSGIAKFVLTPGDGHTIKLSGHYQKYDFANGLGTGMSPRRDNQVETTNLVARYSFSRPDNDWLNINASVYRTTTDTDQTRISGTPVQIGQSRFFRIQTHGADINNTSRYEFGAFKFATTYGVDFFNDRVKTSDPFSNGDETTPSGRRLAYGGFVQQHVKWGMVDVIGALRFDGYELAGGNVKSDGQRLSPKITIGFTPIQGIQPYVTYAQGYRAPSITETLVNGLHPFPASFLFIPNPNLRPEVGKTLEAGVNLKFDNVLKPGDRLRGKVAVFENRVSNFIEAQYNDPGNDCGNPFIPLGCADATYTYQNISRARLRGIEGELAYDAGRWFASVSGSMIRGDNLTLNQPLESIFPDKVSLAGGMRFLDEKLVVGGRATFVGKQNRLPAATLLANASKAYTLLDANVSYEVFKDSRLFVIAENIGDVRYRRFRDGDRSPGFLAKFGFSTRLGM